MSPVDFLLPETCFLFIDESGDFDFNSLGSRHFVMSGVLSLNPVTSAQPLLNLRYQLLQKGVNVSSFHASPDLQIVRNKVFQEMTSLRSIKAHVVYGEKKNLDPSLRTMEMMHSHFTTALIQGMLQLDEVKVSEKLVVVIDQSLPPKKQSAFNRSIKKLFKENDKEFHIYFQSMKTDFNGQIADYIAWSKFKQLERGENRPWESLIDSIAPTEMELSESM